MGPKDRARAVFDPCKVRQQSHKMWFNLLAARRMHLSAPDSSRGSGAKFKFRPDLAGK